MLLQSTQTRTVHGLTEMQTQSVQNFLQGLVYSWCKNNGDWFSVSSLMGGDNYYWHGTPMNHLYDKHQDTKKAGIDAGWLLKTVISTDKRQFDTKVDNVNGKDVRMYKWNGAEV